MNHLSNLNEWLVERNIDNVEIIVSDMAGVARGKIQPAAQLKTQDIKLPYAVFTQAVDGNFFMPKENVADRDMFLRPDSESFRLVPWAMEPTASVTMDCYDIDGQLVEVSPRAVLKRVLKKYEEKGWTPIVAPEVEFYLAKASMGPGSAVEIDEAFEEQLNGSADPYGIDGLHNLGGFFKHLVEQCRIQDIWLGAVSQELGPAQYEVNFQHGPPLKLADDVFHFKRTIKHVARAHDMRVTFLAKPTMEGPGSSMHIHQSVYDDSTENVFSDSAAEHSKLFEFHVGGLQKHMPSALLLFAPYANSYRRFLNHYSSPANLEWGVDNRTVGLRVPRSVANARRIENRLAGSDVNPYLVIAGTLACGYLGMTEKVSPRPLVAGSAYDLPFALHRHMYDALDAFRDSAALRDILGDDFVTLYSQVKEFEYRAFQSHVSDWERNELAFIV